MLRYANTNIVFALYFYSVYRQFIAPSKVIKESLIVSLKNHFRKQNLNQNSIHFKQTVPLLWKRSSCVLNVVCWFGNTSTVLLLFRLFKLFNWLWYASFSSGPALWLWVYLQMPSFVGYRLPQSESLGKNSCWKFHTACNFLQNMTFKRKHSRKDHMRTTAKFCLLRVTSRLLEKRTLWLSTGLVMKSQYHKSCTMVSQSCSCGNCSLYLYISILNESLWCGSSVIRFTTVAKLQSSLSFVET